MAKICSVLYPHTSTPHHMVKKETGKEDEMKKNLVWSKWGLTRNGRGQSSPNLSQEMKKRNIKTKETTEKQRKVKEMILEIQRKEKEKGKEVKEDVIAKDRKDKLPPELNLRSQELGRLRNQRKIQEESTRNQEKTDGRHLDLVTSTPNVHRNAAGEKENKRKEETCRFREIGARKRPILGELFDHFGRIGDGKKTTDSIMTESKSEKEDQMNCPGLSQMRNMAVASDISTEEVGVEDNILLCLTIPTKVL